MLKIFINNSWKKCKKRFPLKAEENELRKNRCKRRLYKVILIVCSLAVCYFGYKLIMYLAGNPIAFDIKLVLEFIKAFAALAGVVISVYKAFPRQSAEDKHLQQRKDYSTQLSERLSRGYVDVHCQDINPADDSDKSPVRQSLREKVWEWLFDPKQTQKSYLQILGDFGTGKTTFCFYIGQEIINTMLSLDVVIIELGTESLDLRDELKLIETQDRKRTILILDAYDEYKKRGSTANEFLELLNLTTNFLKVIITSRTNYFTCAKAEPYLATRYISYFNEEQVKQFFKMNQPFRWRRYWKILERYPQFTDLSRRVILLNYLNMQVLKSMQEAEEKGVEINNYQIYSQIVENILSDDRNANKLLPRQQAIEIMSLLGFHIICCGGDSKVHYASIGKQLIQLLERFNLVDLEMVAFLKKEDLLNAYSNLIYEIRTRTFLVRDNPGYYRFAHRSFTEYFAARFILDVFINKKVFKHEIRFEWPQPVVKFLIEADKEVFLKLLKKIKPIFRSEPSEFLGVSNVEAMLQRYDFFDNYFNPKGKSFIHNYLRYVILNDIVVFDFASGLIWQQGGSLEYMEYENAKYWIRNLNQKGYAGFYDWRLPTLEEAMSLMESKKKHGDLYIDPVFNKKQEYIWTSDLLVNGRSRGWIVGFRNRRCGYDYFNFTNHGYVRAVRSGQSSG